MRSSNVPRVLIVGAGGIGGVVASTLVAAAETVPCELVVLSTNRDIADVVSTSGFRLRVDGRERTLGHADGRARMVHRLDPGEAPFDWVILAVQPPQVEAAAKDALPHLAPGGRLVCLQNGLCEWRLARFAGADRVCGAVVAWGASMPEPGVYERTSDGGFTVGTLDGTMPAELAGLQALLEPVGPVTLTDNLQGARWSKLALNSAVSTLGTLGGDRLGPLMLHRHVRRLALEIMSETVMVARAEGVRLERISGTLDLEWLALTDEERESGGSVSLVAKHTLLLAVGTRYRRMRSSMLAALERGRVPAVDFLNGEVEDRGRAHGIATPVNAAARRLVHRIANKELPSALSTIEALAHEVGVNV